MARRTIDQLYALTIPEVQTVFLKVMQDTVDRAILQEMVKAIEVGDVDALFAASGFTPAVLAPILDRIEEAYRDGAELTVEGWPSRIRTPSGIVQPIFNMRSPRIEQELQDKSSELITRISDEMRENVRQVLTEGMARGENPRRVALDIVGRLDSKTKKRVGGVIGLTENQTRWALSARRYLENLDSKYFSLSLRDKRFDKTVQKAINSNKPLDEETVSKLVTAYKSNALRYRGETVARTEAIQAINRGEDAAIRQAIDEGLVQRKNVKKWWDDTGDLRTRTTHSVLAQKYSRKKAIDIDQPFISPSGSRMMYPGDTSLDADPAEVINCRCKVQYEIDFIGEAADG